MKLPVSAISSWVTTGAEGNNKNDLTEQYCHYLLMLLTSEKNTLMVLTLDISTETHMLTYKALSPSSGGIVLLALKDVFIIGCSCHYSPIITVSMLHENGRVFSI